MNPAAKRIVFFLMCVFFLNVTLFPSNAAEQTNDHFELTIVLSKGAVFRTARVMEINLVLTNKTSEVRKVHSLNSHYKVQFEIRDAKGELVEPDWRNIKYLATRYGTKEIAANESITFPFGLNAQHDLQRGRYSVQAKMTEASEDWAKPITSQVVHFEVR